MKMTKREADLLAKLESSEKALSQTAFEINNLHIRLKETEERLKNMHVQDLEKSAMADIRCGEQSARADFWKRSYEEYFNLRMDKVALRAENSAVFAFAFASMQEGNFDFDVVARQYPEVTAADLRALHVELGWRLPTWVLDLEKMEKLEVGLCV